MLTKKQVLDRLEGLLQYEGTANAHWYCDQIKELIQTAEEVIPKLKKPEYKHILIKEMGELVEVNNCIYCGEILKSIVVPTSEVSTRGIKAIKVCPKECVQVKFMPAMLAFLELENEKRKFKSKTDTHHCGAGMIS